MPKIRLEFDSLKIHRPKRRWRIYFILVTEHPTDPDKMVMTSFPDPYFRMLPPMENYISFEPEGEGADGLNVFEREMPADRTVRTRLFLRHSRRHVRDLGDIINEMEEKFGDNALEVVNDLFATSQPWLVIARSAFPLVGGILKKIKDRKMGWLNMDEHFEEEFDDDGEVDREGKFSTGDATLVWTWSVDDEPETTA